VVSQRDGDARVDHARPGAYLRSRRNSVEVVCSTRPGAAAARALMPSGLYVLEVSGGGGVQLAASSAPEPGFS